MPNLRTAHMDSQRYDASSRRQPSCLPASVINTTAGPQYPVEAWGERRKTTNTPSGRTSLSEHTSEDSDTRISSKASLVESFTSTLGDRGSGSRNKSHQRTDEIHNQEPSLRKSKSSIGRGILCGLDCTRSKTTHTHGDHLPMGEKGDGESGGSIHCLPLLRPGNEICFTDNYVHEDGYTTTRTIIRPRSRSRSTQGAVQGGLARMRSLDCLRGSNQFEDELDSMLVGRTSQQLQLQQQQMRLRVHGERTVVAEEKWRSAVQGMLYPNAQPVLSIESHVEVD